MQPFRRLFWILWAIAVSVLLSVGLVLHPIGENRTRTFTAISVFVAPDGSLKNVASERKIKTDIPHDSLEALLDGPEEGSGLATAIEKRTKLIGCTLSRGVLFIDLSKKFMKSEDITTAEKQVRETALAIEGVKKVVILVDGSPLER